MTTRTSLNTISFLLLPLIGLLAACDGPAHELEVQTTVTVSEAALAEVDTYPAAVVVGLHVVPVEGRGSDFDIGWEVIGVLESPDDASQAVTGVLQTAFGPCTAGDVDVVVKLAEAYEEEDGSVGFGGTSYVEGALEDAFVLTERCAADSYEVALSL